MICSKKRPEMKVVIRPNARRCDMMFSPDALPSTILTSFDKFKIQFRRVIQKPFLARVGDRHGRDGQIPGQVRMQENAPGAWLAYLDAFDAGRGDRVTAHQLDAGKSRAVDQQV